MTISGIKYGDYPVVGVMDEAKAFVLGDNVILNQRKKA
jgi:hypothetical protein